MCSEAELRSAIGSGGIVEICSGTIELSGQIEVSVDVTVRGVEGESALNGGGLTRHFLVKLGVEFRLENVRLVAGMADGGGSVLNDGGHLVFQRCSFEGNRSRSVEVAPSRGGAILSLGGSIQLNECVFNGNIAEGGDRLGIFEIGDAALGGAIAVEDSRLIVVDSLFEGDRAVGGRGDLKGGDAQGGTIFGLRVRATIENSEFLESDARGGEGVMGNNSSGGSAQGGAIAAIGAGSVTIRGSSFERAKAVGNGGYRTVNGSGAGGAIYNEGGLLVQNSKIILCEAKGGMGGGGRGGDGTGGAIHNIGNATIESSRMEANVAQGSDQCGCGTANEAGDSFGGGVFNGGELVLRMSTLEANEVIDRPYEAYTIVRGPNYTFGAGLYNEGIAEVANCTFIENRLTRQYDGPVPEEKRGSGGAIYQASGEVSLVQSTLAGNSLNGEHITPAGGIGIGSGTITIFGCVFDANVPDPIVGSFVDAGFNFTSSAAQPFSHSESANGVDVGLKDPQSLGLQTFLAPRAGSPLIDVIPAESSAETDQLGVARPIGIKADAGAIEYFSQPDITVADDGVTLEYVVQPSAPYQIYSSADLATWEAGETHSANASGQITYTVEKADGEVAQFYYVELKSE